MFKCCSFRACICIMLMCNLIKKLIYFIKFYIYQTHVSKNTQLRWLWTHQEEIADSWLVWSQPPASVNGTLDLQHLDQTLSLGKTEGCHNLFQVSGTKMMSGGSHWRWIIWFHHIFCWLWLCRELKHFPVCSQRTKVWLQDTKSIDCSNILSGCTEASGCWI